MTTHALSNPHTRLNPELSGRFQRAAVAARPTKTQSVLELSLFAVFGMSILLSAIAVYSMYSLEHQRVPNLVARGWEAGRVNVLIIGASRNGKLSETHSLTVMSVKPGEKQAAMISLPRDLWLQVSHFGSHRIGSALNIGESSGYPGEGPGLVSDIVRDVTGQPIHAYVRIDTPDLRAAIDAINGIDIVVEHPFIEKRGKLDRFRAGPAHLDGERAVRYAQSTVVRGPQGGRFARETRQQQVIAAVIDKVAEATPEQRARLAKTGLFSNSTSTNLTAEQIDLLCREVASASAVRHVTMEPLVTAFEVRSVFEAGEAVRPRNGNYEKVQELARNVFAGSQPIAAVR